MNNIFPRLLLVIPIIFLYTQQIKTQPVQIQNASEIELALEKLNVLGSVLYIAAHPDDENTALMAYFSKGKKYRTGYLALTRGDGGQNLIGSEKGVEIGILRTQELLQARKIDGAEQFFTRAIDFGYSKSPEETFDFWGKEEILKDVVWVIRNFKPDVIITRFPIGSSGGHGHHTASALLAQEAFKAAADPQKFPEQLKYVKPWQAKRIFWNNWRPSEEEAKGLVSVDVGEYSTLVAKSYTEIAAQSRSMHKSQGFGASGSRGPRFEYFRLNDGDPANKNVLDGIDATWNRVKNGNAVGEEIKKILNMFDPQNPSLSLPGLVGLYAKINKLEKNYWVEVKKEELINIIRSCAGLWMEAIADDYSAAPGDQIKLITTLVNRSDNHFKLDKIEFPTIAEDSVVNIELKDNQPVSINSKIKIPDSYAISQPYWLIDEPSKGLFKVSNEQMIGLAENLPSIPVKIHFSYDGTKLEYTIPLLYRWNDRVDGELYRPFEIRPPATINVTDKVVIISGGSPREIQVKLKANSSNVKGEVHLHTDSTWKITPQRIPFDLGNKYDEKILTFTTTPPQDQDEAVLKLELNVNGNTYNKSLVEISHPHIERRIYFPESEIKLVRLETKKVAGRIGYVMGSGDEVPDCLRSMGYDVSLLTDEILEADNLSQYDAVITGIRAYNTRDRLKYDQAKLLSYVENGGTLIVQYNVAFGLQTENIGPYPFKLSQDRITDEDAQMNFVNPSHQLFNFPNKISGKDFEGWVQERGLYFANQWDSKYEPIFVGHDPGESDLKGGTIFARFGKGVFIYSGLSWFRQLPAGVPGAYRLFVNMISAGKYGGT